MGRVEHVGQGNQAAAVSADLRDRVADSMHIADRGGPGPDAEGDRLRLDGLDEAFAGRGRGIEHEGDLPDLQRDLAQDLEPFAAEGRLEIGEPCDIATRPRETRDKTTGDRIAIGDEYDRD